MAIICILPVVISTGLFCGCEAKKDFAYWTDGSSSLAELTDYVKAVTNKYSRDYIPKKDRIAVFDLDGTLIGELHLSGLGSLRLQSTGRSRLSGSGDRGNAGNR